MINLPSITVSVRTTKYMIVKVLAIFLAVRSYSNGLDLPKPSIEKQSCVSGAEPAQKHHPGTTTVFGIQLLSGIAEDESHFTV